MNDFDERKQAILGMLRSPAFGNPDNAEKLLPSWISSTQGLPTHQLKRACDECAATWKLARVPKPGDLAELAKRGAQRPMCGEREYELADLFAIVRRRFQDLGFETTDCHLLRGVRNMIAGKIKLSHQAHVDALAQGILTRDQVPFFVAPWTFSSERHAGRMVRELGSVGLLWCDKTRSFKPAAEAISHFALCEREGKPFPPGPTLEQIRAAHGALKRGEVQPADPRIPEPRQVDALAPLTTTAALDALEGL